MPYRNCGGSHYPIRRPTLSRVQQNPTRNPLLNQWTLLYRQACTMAVTFRQQSPLI